RQRPVLIPKPGKQNDGPSSYRPLCVLNTLGKMFERIMSNKLEREVEERGALSSHQHGFRNKQSTIDAIRDASGSRRRKMTGRLQEILPCMYGILRMSLPDGCSVGGFADVIALVTVEKHPAEVSARCSRAIDMLMSWLTDNGLSLAEQKMKAVLISSRKVVEKVSFHVGSTAIESSLAVKYL
ncbi:hypothetical protein KR054_006248, partial [Drosophila jambulina]